VGKRDKKFKRVTSNVNFNMLQLNIMAIPAGTLNTLITLIKISIVIIATVIVARGINRALVVYFKFASGKLKVDETTYTVVRRIFFALFASATS